MLRRSIDATKLDKSRFPTIKDELIPDICAYPRRSGMDNDILRMSEMPILVIEVVSPRQGVLTIVEKLQAYFALGVQSCWLVEPITGVVRIYHPNTDPKTFSAGELIDEVVGIHFPVTEIFE
ncbi:MAG: Uma2 family endonuclease [Caldilineaceae bacterium]|nr:Uma2 family endonuclease [Caldilineaceae bacterium]